MKPVDSPHTLLSLPVPDATGADCIAAYVKQLPDSPGIYRMLDAEDRPLYIGKARSLKKRVTSYMQLERHPIRLQRMIVQTARMEFVLARSEAEALLLEAGFIKQYQPRYNILLKDDKSYPYIRVDRSHAFPRVEKYRSHHAKQGKGLYGPFASAGAVNATITTLQKAFLLRPCSDSIFANRSRPCLQYQIKRCSAPCVGLVEQTDYATLVAQAEAFLSGQSDSIRRQLVGEMEAASARMEFERAAQLRDRIQALTTVQNAMRQQFQGIDDADVIAVYQEGAQCCIQLFGYRSGGMVGNRSFFPAHVEGETAAAVLHHFIGQYYQQHPAPKLLLLNIPPEEAELLESALRLKEGRSITLSCPQRGDKKEAVLFAERNAREALQRQQAEHSSHRQSLEKLAALFELPAPPERIEVYDNSHLMGKHALGAMIVAGPEGFDKKAYRLFNMPAEANGDDFGMMRMLLARRLKHLAADPEKDNAAIRPGLLLIDGGQGQLSAVLAILEELGLSDIPVAAIAKGPERNAGREQIFLPGRAPFQLPHHDPLLHYLQRLRDEAHRFAIGAHRKKRSKALITSSLDAVPGVGPTRKKKLLQYFGSARSVADATLDDLKAVPGINDATAEAVYRHYHP